MKPKFAILIPTITDERDALLARLLTNLDWQITQLNAHDQIKILVNPDKREKTTGLKRNELLSMASQMGCYGVAFHDDDDLPGDTYVQRIIDFMNSGCDCAGLVGQIYFDGKPGKPFLHSIKNTEWWEDHQYYYRMPNHLNFMKMDAIKDIHFPDQVFGEDAKFSYACRDAGVFKTEFEIPEVIYHYFCGYPKHKL